MSEHISKLDELRLRAEECEQDGRDLRVEVASRLDELRLRTEKCERNIHGVQWFIALCLVLLVVWRALAWFA